MNYILWIIILVVPVLAMQQTYHWVANEMLDCSNYESGEVAEYDEWRECVKGKGLEWALVYAEQRAGIEVERE